MGSLRGLFAGVVWVGGLGGRELCLNGWARVDGGAGSSGDSGEGVMTGTRLNCVM